MAASCLYTSLAFSVTIASINLFASNLFEPCINCPPIHYSCQYFFLILFPRIFPSRSLLRVIARGLISQYLACVAISTSSFSNYLLEAVSSGIANIVCHSTQSNQVSCTDIQGGCLRLRHHYGARLTRWQGLCKLQEYRSANSQRLRMLL